MFFRKYKISSSHLLFILFLIVYIFLNIDRLNLPYFWDELACYYRSSHYLYHHQISIFPSAVPSDISYDHPLLIQNIVAILLHIFVNSPVVVHLFFLIISCVFIVFMYKTAHNLNLNFFSPIAVIFIAVQPVFIAQNMLFQLEMVFSFLCFISVYFYSIKNYQFYLIFACLNVLVKESAIVVPISLFLYEIFLKLKLKTSLKLNQKQLISLLPILLFILFITITKLEKGYFLSPINSGKTSFYFDVFKQRLTYCFSFVFFSQGRLYFSIVFLCLLFYVIFIKKMAYRLKELILLPFNFQSVIFILMFFVFSAINNPLERYLLVLIPFIVFIFFQLLILCEFHQKFILSLTSLLIVISLLNSQSKHRFTDSDLSYVSHIKCMQHLKAYLYQNQLIDKSIKADWPVVFSLQNNEFGLVEQKHNSIYLMNQDVNEKIDLYIYTIPGNLEEKQVPDSLKLLKNIEESYAKCQIWVKK